MNIFNKALLISLISTPLLFADGCWDALELANYSERSLDEEITVFSFKDAVSCEPLSEVSVSFLGKDFTSDSNGTLHMPQPPEEIDASVPIEILKKGYIPVKKRVPVSLGNYWQNLFVLSKEIPLESARFILSWGKRPSDLDLHLKSSDFHISYRKTRSIPNRVKLDRDAREGYGPETITLDRLKKEKEYKLLIHRYSADGSIDKETKLSVYLNNRFDRTLFLDKSDARCLQVATIKNRKIDYEIKELPDSQCR